ncbi:MAG TPA: ParA family protein [Casimicrobiaceae bacterium]
MHTILVANPKGGSGKTTLATNIAGWLAGKRQRVVLEDRDPQQSSAFWLSRRPALFPSIIAASGATTAKELKAEGVQWRVIDSAAGMHGDELRDAVRAADVMLIPVSPSVFDMAATARFLHAIAELKAVKQGDLAVGLVGMRVDVRTHSSADLDEFMQSTGVPVVAQLRGTQVYVYCARDGASIFDLPRSRAEQDLEQWRPLTRWIARHAPSK